MTIDDCIDWLCRLRSNVLIFMPYVWHKKMTDALTMAIDIMRKYQKIEEILDQLIDSKIRTYDAVTEIEDIVFGQAEVEDGNDEDL